MSAHELSFVPLLVVVFIAFAVPLLLARLRRVGIPIVVGEIVAGILVGRSGLDLVEEGFLLRVLSDLGFAYLMFLSGLEIDFGGILGLQNQGPTSRVRRFLGSPVVVGAVIFALTLGGSALAANGLHGNGMVRDPWLLALILATTSLGVVVPVLKESGLANSGYGQSLLWSALIADFSSILLIGIYVIIRSQGLTTEVLLVLLLIAAFLVTYRSIAVFRERLPLDRLFSRLSAGTTQIRTRGAFALALVFIGLSETLGVENILGAFLAGVIVSAISKGESSVLRQKLDAIGYGFFIPIFFVMVGVGFDLPALVSSPSAMLLVPILVGISYAVKVLPAFMLRIRFSWRDTLAGGLLLSSRLSLIIAASAIGLEMGAISEAVNAAVILVAIVTCTVSPILFNLLSEKAGPRDRVIVMGRRAVAPMLVRSLRAHHLDVTLVSDAPTTVASGQNQETLVTTPNESFLDTLREAGIEQSHAVVMLDTVDDINLRLCRVARHQFGVFNVVAWVEDVNKNEEFRQAGAHVVNPSTAAMRAVESMVLTPGEGALDGDVDVTHDVRVVKLKNRELVGRRIGDIPGNGDLTILSVERRGNVFSPEIDAVLEANDTITLVGERTAVIDIAVLIARAR